MADHPLTGRRLLVAGGDRSTAGGLVARLGAAGAQAVESEADAEIAAARAVSAPPDAIVALGSVAGPLRAALDPFGLDAGPPVVEVTPEALSGGDPGAADHTVARLTAALEMRGLRDRIVELETVVAEHAVRQANELEAGRLDALSRLGRAAEYRDDNTWEHTQRVAQLAARMARLLGSDRRQVAVIRRTAPLHDIGKVAIPDAILLKPGSLTEEEYEVVKTHTVVGARVLAEGGSDLLRTAEQIARSHHERWDGEGYPDGLRGEEIPQPARLVQVADVFDILTHERPHREAWTVEEAAAEIRRGAGSQFDPRVVRAFEDLGPEVWRAPAPMRDWGSVAGPIG